MAHLTRPAEISGVSAGSFPETAAGNCFMTRVAVCQFKPNVPGLTHDRLVAKKKLFLGLMTHV